MAKMKQYQTVVKHTNDENDLNYNLKFEYEVFTAKYYVSGCTGQSNK